MMAVMSLASRLEAEEASKKEETIGRLQTENQVRVTLGILFKKKPKLALLIKCNSYFNHSNI